MKRKPQPRCGDIGIGIGINKLSSYPLSVDNMNAFEQPAPVANADGGTDAVGFEVQATWNNEDPDPEAGIDEPPALVPAHAPENPHRWILRRNWSGKGKYVAAALLLTTMAVGTGVGVWERENRKINANQNTAMVVMPKAPKSSNSPRPSQAQDSKSSKAPSSEPSSMPSATPSLFPSKSPEPSGVPSLDPSFEPSDLPSFDPSFEPSIEPTSEPSLQPSESDPVPVPICLTAVVPESNFQYFRFQQTKLRGCVSSSSCNPGRITPNSVQLSEMQLYSGSTQLSVTSATNPGGNNPSNQDEGPAKAIDNNGGTKWLDFNKGPIILGFSSSVTIDGYRWYTANDRNGRDAMRWTLEGSNDQSTWVMIDDRSGTDQAVPLARFTPVCLEGPPAPPAPTPRPTPKSR